MHLEPLYCFTLSCVIIYILYPIVNKLIEFNYPSFKMLRSDKKDYVSKNLIKACCLISLSIASYIHILPDIYYNNVWNNLKIRCFASIYVSNDAVALMRVKKLHLTTRLHHTVSFLFLLYSWCIDFKTSHIGQKIFVYTITSALAAPVNLFLGLRMITNDLQQLKLFVKYEYLFLLIVNWIYQLITWKWSYETYVYIFFIIWVLLDDIVLLKFLWRKP